MATGEPIIIPASDTEPEEMVMKNRVLYVHWGTKYQHPATQDCPICIGAARMSFSKFEVGGN